MSKRRTLKLTGRDVDDFLQGLITNDIAGLDDGLVYAALLTPQGKYIADFFVLRHDGGVVLDVAEPLADMLGTAQHVQTARGVSIEPAPMYVHRGTGTVPSDGFADPRHAELGWRAYRDTPQEEDHTDWTALRVAHLIPQSGIELTPDTFILEAGFERLKGVDFRKGCYVGQEVTARMKHKTELRKGLARVQITGPAEPGAEITAAGKPAGTLLSRSGEAAIAYLRFDRATGEMQAGDATLRRQDG